MPRATKTSLPTAVGAGPEEPFDLLHKLRKARLSGDAFRPNQAIASEVCSRHNTSGRGSLGLGYVQAVLAILHGCVTTITYGCQGFIGRVVAKSIAAGSSTTYVFAWKEDAGRCELQGFKNGPTYQAALVGLCQIVARYIAHGPHVQTHELVQRWYELVQAMDRFSPRDSREIGWTEAVLEAACVDPTISQLILGVCDALYFAMRYDLVSMEQRQVFLFTDIDPLGTFDERLPGSILLQHEPGPAAAGLDSTPETDSADPSASDKPGATTDPMVSPSAAASTATASTAVRSRSSSASATTSASTVGPSAPSVPKALTMYGAHLDRVMRALARGRTIFLVGPTGTGKTSIAKHAAQTLGVGIELCQIDDSVDAKSLIGTYRRRVQDVEQAGASSPTGPDLLDTSVADDPRGMRPPRWLVVLQQMLATQQAEIQVLREQLTALQVPHSNDAESTGGWEAVDGVVTRWARRAIAGERVMLLLDELPHGHKSVVGTVMSILNTHDRWTIEAQGLSIPPNAEDCARFHIIDVWTTKERLVVPADRVCVVATANIGDRYHGLSLENPAFRRRWEAWIEMGPYPPNIVMSILADHLDIAATAPLIGRLNAVAVAVDQYQQKHEKLIATLDIATLICWGTAALDAARRGKSARVAFSEAAQDVWVDRIAPRKGGPLDPEVVRDLNRLVTDNAPTTFV